jgi:ADP-heptose:LPS heptosyltransferase
VQVTPQLLQVERRAEEVRTPGERLEGVRRMVVVRDDRLGDLVLSLPAVDALRRAYPEARLALMVRPDLVPLARAVPIVDDVIGAEGDRSRLRSEIAEFGADLVVCISRGAGVPRAAAREGVRQRVGTGYRIYSPLFTRTVNERRRAGNRHEAEYALSFAHRVGAPAGPANFPLVIPDGAQAAVADWRSEHGFGDAYAVLHPGSGGSCPGWPVGRFIELAERLRSEGVDVAFSIGPQDARCVEALDAAPADVRALPRYSGDLERVSALLRSAALVVGSSTGPLHLAAALGTPTLGIYAPWATCAVARWGPYAANGWAIAAASSEARRWSRSERRRRGDRLLAAIPSEVVSRCALALLAGREPTL